MTRPHWSRGLARNLRRSGTFGAEGSVSSRDRCAKLDDVNVRNGWIPDLVIEIGQGPASFALIVESAATIGGGEELVPSYALNAVNS
jgi:hypothetical protein